MEEHRLTQDETSLCWACGPVHPGKCPRVTEPGQHLRFPLSFIHSELLSAAPRRDPAPLKDLRLPLVGDEAGETGAQSDHMGP